jgi:hypothetical protein
MRIAAVCAGLWHSDTVGEFGLSVSMLLRCQVARLRLLALHVSKPLLDSRTPCATQLGCFRLVA